MSDEIPKLPLDPEKHPESDEKAASDAPSPPRATDGVIGNIKASLGFTKLYNVPLFVVFAGSMFAFVLSR